jgi:hypothetical protein
MAVFVTTEVADSFVRDVVSEIRGLSINGQTLDRITAIIERFSADAYGEGAIGYSGRVGGVSARSLALAEAEIKNGVRCAGRPARSRWCKSTAMKE